MKVPPYIFPLLILSKRLHSLFLLRLFNDCFAVGALFVATYAYQRRIWTIGSIAYSWGLAIKMSLLLASPAIGIILLQALPLQRAFKSGFIIMQVQVRISRSPKTEGMRLIRPGSGHACFPFLASQRVWLCLPSIPIH